MNAVSPIASSSASSNRTPGEWPKLALIFGQLVLLLLLLHELDILNPAFRRIVAVAVPAFLVNHFLPPAFRLRFFVGLSFACMLLVLGTPPDPDQFWSPALALPRTALILSMGLGLIWICRLPLGFWTRATLLIGVGAVAACFRAGLLSTGGFEIIWIIIAALFMFRVIVYLYDVSTSPVRPPLLSSMAYFFLIPNVCCSLFPVIDFKTFHRSHYNAGALEIYQRGARWMTWGVFHLLIFRYVDQVFATKAAWVNDGTSLIRFLVTNSLLYLNVSGQFHFIVGLLLLFGFNLPRTNHRYFLASSFTDYWRRVNIYWKDFMLKVFYYPAFFRLKKRGSTTALVVATLWAFFITWVLHLYQTWWIKGTAAVSWPDTLFWLILGLLILANSLFEMKHGRKRTLASSTYTAGEAIGTALRTAGTFATISILWSLWSSPSLEVWLQMWRYADRSTLVAGIGVLLLVMAAKLLLEILPTWRAKRQPKPEMSPEGPTFWRSQLLRGIAPLVLLYAVAVLGIRGQLPDPRLDRFHHELATQPLLDVLETGDSFPPRSAVTDLNYYQQLASVDEGNRQLWEMLIQRPIAKVVSQTERPVIKTQDFRLEIPKASVPPTPVYEISDYQTNRWGMRDHDYSQSKPAGTLRIAVLGSSHTMGYGVKLEESFENRVEARLNETPPVGATGQKFEILNFAHLAYGPLSQTIVLQQQVDPFHPDIVILVGHLKDVWFVNFHLRNAAQRKLPIPDPKLQQILQEARIGPKIHDALAERRLARFEPELMEYCFDSIARECRRMGALPVYFFIPATPRELPLTPARSAEADTLKQLARSAGFAVIDGAHIFDHEKIEDITFGVDPHSSTKGHALIADRLYDGLVRDPEINLSGKARELVSSTLPPENSATSH